MQSAEIFMGKKSRHLGRKEFCMQPLDCSRILLGLRLLAHCTDFRTASLGNLTKIIPMNYCFDIQGYGRTGFF